MHDRVTRQTKPEQKEKRTKLTAIHAIRQQANSAARTNMEIHQYITGDFCAVRTVLNENRGREIPNFVRNSKKIGVQDLDF